MTPSHPGEVEHYSFYSSHFGPRFESAGLRVQFHSNQEPGFHFKTQVSGEYKVAILKGLQEGLALHFPDFPATASVWITEVTEHEVHSSSAAFYNVARLVIDQAAGLLKLRPRESASGHA